MTATATTVAPDDVRPGGAPRYRFGYWAAALTYFAIQAFMTVPSPLYALYARHDGFSSFTITLVYAAYAVGVIVSLVLAGHLSDVFGRRPLLLTALALNAVSAIVFMTWSALPGLFLARVICGLAVGVTAATATAYLNELFLAHRSPAQLHRVQLLSTATALGGLGAGGLIAGVSAQVAGHPFVIPYAVMLAVLMLCGVAVLIAPETRPLVRPLPRYRPQRPAMPRHARGEFVAALTGVATQFAVFGLFVGLAGTFLAAAVHNSALWLSGATLCLVFAAGVCCAAVTTSLSHRALVLLAVVSMLAGLVLLVVSVWLPRPSLAVFLVAGVALGAGGAALFKTSLGVVVAVAPADRRAETLAGFFLAGYIGMSLPVVGMGIALQHLSMRASLLGFAVVIALAVAVAGPALTKIRNTAPESGAGG